MNRLELLKLFQKNTGKTTYVPKSEKNPVPFQTSRIQNYQMTGRRG